MTKFAWLSDDRTYRYSLSRIWDSTGSRVLWVMLNPSTADETQDDLTIRKCMEFTKRWGFGSLEVVNLFAYRATEPRALRFQSYEKLVGPSNDNAILNAITTRKTRRVVAAWGGGDHTAFFQSRRQQVLNWIRSRTGDPFCLGTTMDGAPRHPSRVGYSVIPVPYVVP